MKKSFFFAWVCFCISGAASATLPSAQWTFDVKPEYVDRTLRYIPSMAKEWWVQTDIQQDSGAFFAKEISQVLPVELPSEIRAVLGPSAFSVLRDPKRPNVLEISFSGRVSGLDLWKHMVVELHSGGMAQVPLTYLSNTAGISQNELHQLVSTNEADFPFVTFPKACSSIDDWALRMPLKDLPKFLEVLFWKVGLVCS